MIRQSIRKVNVKVRFDILKWLFVYIYIYTSLYSHSFIDNVEYTEGNIVATEDLVVLTQYSDRNNTGDADSYVSACTKDPFSLSRKVTRDDEDNKDDESIDSSE